MEVFIFGNFYLTGNIEANVCENTIEFISYHLLICCYIFSISEENGKVSDIYRPIN